MSFIIGGSKGGLRGLQPSAPFQISKIKESNKTKQKIGDNPLEKEEERKSCMFVNFLCVHALKRVSTNIFFSKFPSSPPPPFLKNFWIRAWNALSVDTHQCGSIRILKIKTIDSLYCLK